MQPWSRPPSMPRYRAVLFDLCDTLLHFDPERLPLIEAGDQPTRSTAHIIHEALAAVSVIPFDIFYPCLLTVTAEIAAARERDYREITSQERFRRVLERLGADARPEAANRLVTAHMSRLANALVLPSHHPEVLTRLARNYRLAVVTNFDHAPTVRAVLRRDGLETLFETVVISGEVGWRKPHRRIFDIALSRLGIPPADALFIGDNLALDVVGAAQAGLAAAWYTRGRHVEPHGEFPAIADLTDLPGLL